MLDNIYIIYNIYSNIYDIVSCMSVQLGASSLLNISFAPLANFPLYPLGKGTCAQTWLRCALKRPSLADCRCATSCRCSQVYLTICLCTFHICIYTVYHVNKEVYNMESM